MYKLFTYVVLSDEKMIGVGGLYIKYINYLLT